jgi:hypothetical protein
MHTSILEVLYIHSDFLRVSANQLVSVYLCAFVGAAFAYILFLNGYAYFIPCVHATCSANVLPLYYII